MSNEIKTSSEGNVPATNQSSGVDHGRRLLGKAGVAGTGVLLTFASRSAMAGENSCGSELASGNLSGKTRTNDCGCSPGFW